jgi:hypothetical protein|tara:strand:- start:11698 stop:12144 length:447 start_codon:yes stop_codon:yes gene_type:complete
MKNVCPSCGAALYKDSEVQKISLIKTKIMSQEFAQAMSKEDVFDISLFILSEFLDSPDVKASDKISDINETDEGLIHNDLNPDDIEDNFNDIRKEIQAEYGESGQLHLDEDINDGESDSEELRIARLKRLAKESPALNKGGATVRRVT